MRPLLPPRPPHLLPLLFRRHPSTLTSTSPYVTVRMKWKKDPYYDAVPLLSHSAHLKPILSLCSIISRSPDLSIPVSSVSKLSRSLELPCRVAAFLRRYPSFFLESPGPPNNHPWFRLTPRASSLLALESRTFASHRSALLDRLCRLILMSIHRCLPLQIVHGMQWYLGLPEDFIANFDHYSDGEFRSVDMGDGVCGLRCTLDDHGTPLSTMQRMALRNGMAIGPDRPVLAFPLYPSKGVRLKRKIAGWLEGFQTLPYVSPYEDFSDLDTNSDAAEKRAVGVLHELLCLFIDHSAERRRIRCLRKHLGLPQKFHQVFERHPHVFYLHLKNKTCSVVLKEGYQGGGESAIERHPMAPVREAYVRLMMESDNILRRRRSRPPRGQEEMVGDAASLQ